MTLRPDTPPAHAPARPGPPADAETPAFAAPWQAQAFAMVVALHEKGLFTWPEWAAALAAQIKTAQAAGDRDTGETYYAHWLAALEALLAAKSVTTPEALARYRDAWDAAAHRTPIELQAEDFAD
jgi:nitrile hydratase accessory protein